MTDKLKTILEEAGEELRKAASLEDAESLRVRLLGKKGQLTEILRSMKDYSPEERKTMGQAAIEQTISANKYLQNQKDADAADPDPNREELLERQLTVGLGKKDGIQAAHDQAGN